MRNVLSRTIVGGINEFFYSRKTSRQQKLLNDLMNSFFLEFELGLLLPKRKVFFYPSLETSNETYFNLPGKTKKNEQDEDEVFEETFFM
jgi:hypothetical protein